MSIDHSREPRVAASHTCGLGRCDCDASRITTVLKSYAPEERAGLADPDGIIRARCEFCGTTHEIAPDELA